MKPPKANWRSLTASQLRDEILDFLHQKTREL